jgi:hypothetical protein
MDNIVVNFDQRLVNMERCLFEIYDPTSEKVLAIVYRQCVVGVACDVDGSSSSVTSSKPSVMSII